MDIDHQFISFRHTALYKNLAEKGSNLVFRLLVHFYLVSIPLPYYNFSEPRLVLTTFFFMQKNYACHYLQHRCNPFSLLLRHSCILGLGYLSSSESPTSPTRRVERQAVTGILLVVGKVSPVCQFVMRNVQLSLSVVPNPPQHPIVMLIYELFSLLL